MSAPVDVLAVLQNEIDHAGCLGPRASEARARRLESVRDAVADIIDALEMARKQMAHRGCGRVRPTSEWAQHGSMSFDNCECDIRRVDAVRARVKGGAR